jgi:hypothetical protein
MAVGRSAFFRVRENCGKRNQSVDATQENMGETILKTIEDD